MNFIQIPNGVCAMAESKGVCLIVGVGDGLGSALARAFAAEGHVVCMTRRARHLDDLQALADEIGKSGGQAHAYGVDARAEDEMVALFETIERDVGALEVVVFNIGANVRFGIRETTARIFTKVWEMACFAGFIAGREAAKAMVPRGRGTILFTGATASVRGRDGFAAFAAAKHGLRAVAQSMARELGPEGIHVAHVVIDGAVDGVFIRENRQDVDTLLADSRILRPEDIAQSYVALARQPRSAWTHELDLRPWTETW
jgi:NAD(P)-dependent dehydrogenase (short-subunit alcohol dehydrogenase family)